MTEAIETRLTLTSLDRSALRQADCICFDHGPESGIRCIKRGKPPFYQDATHLIRCYSTVYLHGEGLDYEQRNGKGAFGFAMIHSALYQEEWQTIVALLRNGDEIHLRWIGPDNNGYLDRSRVTEATDYDRAGLGEPLYHDRLYLKIKRGKKTLSFHVHDSVCPNNSARMIRSY